MNTPKLNQKVERLQGWLKMLDDFPSETMDGRQRDYDLRLKLEAELEQAEREVRHAELAEIEKGIEHYRRLYHPTEAADAK